MADCALALAAGLLVRQDAGAEDEVKAGATF